MKKILIFLVIPPLLLFTPVRSWSQMIVNAGPDKAACSDWSGITPVQIGGSPSVIGGIPPYTYTWEAYYHYVIGSYSFYFFASDYLNDTTLANPTVIYCNTDSLYFFLTVRDSENHTGTDHMMIRYAPFAFVLDDKRADIFPGDSVRLYSSVFGGIAPVTYQWTPDYNLSSANVPEPWAKPLVSTSYYNTATDASGCQATDMDAFEVYVIPEGITGKTSGEKIVSIDPDPLVTVSMMNLEGSPDNAEIRFYDGTGRLFRVIHPVDQHVLLDRNDFSPGVCFYILLNYGRILDSGKLIIW